MEFRQRVRCSPAIGVAGDSRDSGINDVKICLPTREKFRFKQMSVFRFRHMKNMNKFIVNVIMT